MAGLTLNGFDKKTLQQIKAEYESGLKGIFGNDIDVSETSQFGQLISLYSKRESNIWDLLEAVYASKDPNSAEGVNLDRVLAMVSSNRLPAIATTVKCVLYGVTGTLIASGKKIAKDGTGEEFALLSDTTIDKSNAVYVEFEPITVADSTLYEMVLNGTTYQYTSSVGASAISIIAGMKAIIDASGEPVDYVDNNDGTGYIKSDDNLTTFTFVETDFTLLETGTNGDFEAVEIGEIIVSTNTMTDIVTSVSGWTAVNNLLAGTTGRSTETDEDFRIRNRLNQRSTGAGTDEAIKARILEDVENVTDVKVISNRTSSTDSESRPPKSFEVVATGGLNQDIADKIWETQPSGIESYGNQTLTVIDSEGDSQTIKFSRPENIYTWLEIDITLYDEEIFPTDGTTQIKQAIDDFGVLEYKIGVDFLRERLYQPIFSISGIKSAVISVGTSASPLTPPASYSELDISINDREIVSISQNRMTVGIV